MCHHAIMKTPKQLVAYFGNQTKAADALGYTKAAVSFWVKNGKLPRNVEKHFESHIAAWGSIKDSKEDIKTNNVK